MSTNPPPAPATTGADLQPTHDDGAQAPCLSGSPALFLVLGIGLIVIGYPLTLFGYDDYSRTAILEPESASLGLSYFGLTILGVGFILLLVALWRFAGQFHAVYRKLVGV